MAKNKPVTASSAARTNTFHFGQLSPWKRDLVLIGALYIILLVLFNEIVFKNMIFSDSGDTAAAEAWGKAVEHIQQTENVEPLWIPYIFSGMPIFGAMILPRSVNYFFDDLLQPIARVLFFNAQLHWLLLPFLVMGIAMYCFARQLKFSSGASFIAALTMMLNPYAIGLPETGHGSKLIVLSMVPLFFLCIFKLFEKRNILWTGLVGLVGGTMLLGRHPQMAFYGLLVSGLYLLYEFIMDIRKEPGTAVKKSVLFLLAVGLGFALYAYQFLPTNEYAQYSIRGGGAEGAGVSSGLDYEYATNWSFHPLEVMNFVIPSFMGIVARPESWQQQNAYWGWMPFTNSYVYLGIVPLFLGITALIYRRNRFTWFLAILAVIFLFISFGKHFSVLFDLMFKFFPYFNKFRVPVMILHLMPMVLGLLAAYGFSFFAELPAQAKEVDLAKLRRRLTMLLAVIGGLLVVGIVLNGTVESILSGMMFQKTGEFQQLRQAYGAQASQAVAELKKIRFELFWKDYVKFAVIAGAGIGLVIMYLKRKVQPGTLAVGLALITIIDLWILDVQYINPKPNSAMADRFQTDEATQRLQAEGQKELFRVYPAGEYDQGNRLMYHHIQEVEGYSPAKLKIYQEMRDSCLGRGNMNVFSMLNVKYIVGERQAQDGTMQSFFQPNPGYLPRVWFVDSAVVSRSKQETFSILNSPAWNPRTTAILEKGLPAPLGKHDSALATVTSYSSRRITISTRTAAPALLVVSEIYYPAGWKASVDGAETEIYKTNHILRAIVVPGGSHVVEFTFNPLKYDLGYAITETSWGVTVLLVLAGALQMPGVRKRIGWKMKEK